MSDAVFPSLPGLAWSVTRRPLWQTRVQTSVSGRETRTADWSAPRWQWELAYELLRDDASDELRSLLGFFLLRQGAFDSFLFRDPDDNAVTGQTIDLNADGTATGFQLIRTLGGFPEPVAAADTVSAVYLDGVAQPSGGWSVDAATAVLSFASPPPAGSAVSADFSFYFRVRFAEDQADFEKFAHKLWALNKITLVSLK
jgi:uncharacterized protein (TIGR02217 family)